MRFLALACLLGACDVGAGDCGRLLSMDQGSPSSLDPTGPVVLTTDGVLDIYVPMVKIPATPGLFAVVTFSIGGADQSDPNAKSYVASGSFTAFSTGGGPDANALTLDKVESGAVTTIVLGGDGDSIGLEVGTADADIVHTLKWSVQTVPAP